MFIAFFLGNYCEKCLHIGIVRSIFCHLPCLCYDLMNVCTKSLKFSQNIIEKMLKLVEVQEIKIKSHSPA